MKYAKWVIMLSILMIAFCFLPSLVHAQPDPGSDPDAVVPIDGGISFLAAAGVAYSIKKIKESREKKLKRVMEREFK